MKPSSRNEFKDLADAVGMPDDEDYKYIKTLIEAYDRAHPGELPSLRDYARQNSMAGKNDYGIVQQTAQAPAGYRYMLELPEILLIKIEKYIPTMFSNKRHFAWFKKKFPGLLIPRKI